MMIVQVKDMTLKAVENYPRFSSPERLIHLTATLSSVDPFQIGTVFLQHKTAKFNITLIIHRKVALATFCNPNHLYSHTIYMERYHH